MAVTTENDAQSLLATSIGPACHELRSPLAVVYGFAKMLEGADFASDEQSQRYVGQIVKGAQRLDELLELFSRLGRIAAGRLHPNIESVSLRAIADDLAATNANRRRVEVEGGDDVNVKVDAEWLAEAFHGVLDTVCFEDGIVVRVSWTHEPHTAHVSFVPRSPYPLVETDPSKSGLALALARMRIMTMGGTLEGREDRVLAVLPRA